MPETIRCTCGAEYTVEGVSGRPRRCRFCGGDDFREVMPPSDVRPVAIPVRPVVAPTGGFLDRLETETYGGTREAAFGVALLFAYLLPLTGGGAEPRAAWEVLAAGGVRTGLPPLALPGAAGILAIVLGLFLPGRHRGPIVTVAAAAALLAGPGLPTHCGVGEWAPLGIGAAGLAIGGVSVLGRVPGTATGRLLTTVGAAALLAVLMLIQRRLPGGMPDPRTDLVPTIGVTLAFLAPLGAFAVAVKSVRPLVHLAALLPWAAALTLATAVLLAPATGDPIYEVGPLLVALGLLGLIATGSADALLAFLPARSRPAAAGSRVGDPALRHR